MSTSLPQAKVLPWGQLEELTKGKSFDLSRSKHCVGRVLNRCDIQIPYNFISALHCIIRLQGKDDHGEPIVEIEDVSSRNGLWVNDEKVGNRRKKLLKKGDVIKFSGPKNEFKFLLLYRPSGLTQTNEELHARLSADEMSVADRTRKRTHDEIQGTQSPMKVVRSPPRPRAVKKMRQVAQLSQETESQHADDPTSTATTQQSILELQRKLKFAQEELALQCHQESLETPPSKRQIVQKERNKQAEHSIVARKQSLIQVAQDLKEIVSKLTEDSPDPPNLSGSSQSQDSIDHGNLRSGRRNSQQLSGCSNENSEPSPADQLLAVDEESKNGDASNALFDTFGARRPNSSTGSTSSRATTLSQSQLFRGRRHDDTVVESKEQQSGEGADEETKGGI
ncbi:Kinase-like protein [Phytophthora palmivora]|uniref:Kinase-like protein n=1 Tax=Phytophthora palmivora TaxID=4796 RepID=A0A2P4X1H7_9STRA|nr:Kinase-like protein [Phytophthora palmivora]